MIRSFGKLVSQALLLLAPMLTVGWSFLNLLGYPGDAHYPTTVNLLFFPLVGEKEQVEMQLRVIASLVGFGLLVAYEVLDTFLPRRDLAAFRTAYLKQEKEEWRKDPTNQIPPEVRINIMHVRHPWYTLFFGRFYWTWSDGFVPPHHQDANLRLTTYQGVAGTAFRTKAVAVMDFRNDTSTPARFQDCLLFIAVAAFILIVSIPTYWYTFHRAPVAFFSFVLIGTTAFLTLKIVRLDRFRLWPWQARKTAGVKYILSIPLFKELPTVPASFKHVGVINLDTTSDKGVKFLMDNEGRLVDYFTDRGKVIACLR
jgi:hypothetical protein